MSSKYPINIGSKGLIKNTNKGKNIFQKDYDDIYKPKFKGPKVVSENLGFYNRDTIDFEQDMDSENKNPPYFGKRLRKKLKDDDEDRGKGENAELRVGFLYKGRQVDIRIWVFITHNEGLYI